MAKGEKRLDDMRNNPAGDWTIDDIQVVCRANDITVEAPSGGSHWGIFYPGVGIQTIPYRRRIKARYIKEFVSFVDRVRRTKDDC
jgi:hypothetical protein